MAKKVTNIEVKDTVIRTLQQNGIDYVCITDIARQKNAEEPNLKGSDSTPFSKRQEAMLSLLVLLNG